MKILCIIPARSGSKGIPNKNIKDFCGKPLLVWSIEQAKKSKYTMDIILSTDSEDYANIGRQYGARIPFLRPRELSQDNSTDYEFIKYTLDNLDYKPDIILQLRPTQPCRKIEDIDKCLDLFIENFERYDSLRTVVEVDKTPYKMYSINNNELIPLFKEVNGMKEPFNKGRQYLPKTYLHNGYIDIMKASIVKDGMISGDKIYAYVMDKNDTIDIDNQEDWDKAELSFNYFK